jgi:saccharopine dehydrogenase (NAD+, L-lysine-forming)
MTTTVIAIIKEEKIPVDTRTPITPAQAKEIEQRYPSLRVICQSSKNRCFSDDEYRRQGIEIVDDVGHADILLGVKEVKIENLVPNKTYLFFSHTIKKQPYNQLLLQSIMNKRIRLIDYERLTSASGARVIAFGRWAGIVGAYNAMWAYGQKYACFSLKRAFECQNVQELHSELDSLNLPPVKILLTGNGRVAHGSLEVLKYAGIRYVEPRQYLLQQFDEPVYTQIDVDIYTKHREDKPFSFYHFFSNPQEYVSNFHAFSKTTDVLIMAAFWDPNAPRLFEIEDVKDEGFKIRVIADITCDINGSVPTTIRPTTIDNPVYDYDLQNLHELPPFSAEAQLSVMSIDNLPNELPRDASSAFGEQLVSSVLPGLLKSYDEPVIKRATITADGKLTEAFSYLQGYVSSK